jgi:hypothetical protein
LGPALEKHKKSATRGTSGAAKIWLLATRRLVLRGRRKIKVAKKVAVAEHDLRCLRRQGKKEF